MGLASWGALGGSMRLDHARLKRNEEGAQLKAANGWILADHVPAGSGSTQERSQSVALPICIAVLVVPLGQGA